MRAALVVLVAVGCGAELVEPNEPALPERPAVAAKKPAPRPLRIPRFAFRAGDTIHGTHRQDIRSRGGDDAMRFTRERVLEVLAVDADGVITKARVAYPRDEHESRHGGRVYPGAPILSGAYVAEMKRGTLQLRREGGGPPIVGQEARHLELELRAFVGHPDYTLRAGIDRPLEPGVFVPIDPRIGDALGRETTLREAKVRLLEVRGETAVLEEVLVYRTLDDGLWYDAAAVTMIELSVTSGRRSTQATTWKVDYGGASYDAETSLVQRLVPAT